MFREVLEYSPVSRETLFYNEDEIIVATKTDVTDLIERNKAMMAQTDERAPWAEWTHVAAIPAEVMEDLHRKGILRDNRAFNRWLNDNYNQAFRTRPGRI